MHHTSAIIAAMSPQRIIGVDGGMPWHYPADLKYFKRLTRGGTVIMGRHTWESLPKKPLPDRRNIVITRSRFDGVECFDDTMKAMDVCSGRVWFIGGAEIFKDAMWEADYIYLTIVPDIVDTSNAKKVVYFPAIDSTLWYRRTDLPHKGDPRLHRHVYWRR